MVGPSPRLPTREGAYPMAQRPEFQNERLAEKIAREEARRA